MQSQISLIFGAIVVYLLFFRKGGMGMACCGSHGSNGDHNGHDSHGSHRGHSAEPDKDKQPDDLSAVIKEDIIDLREDQYTVLTVEEDKHAKTIDRTTS
jgi:hypothetical protein